MMWEVRRFRPGDDCSKFDSYKDGNQLGKWLRDTAPRMDSNSISRVYVLVPSGKSEVFGYYTLSSHAVAASGLSRKQRAGKSSGAAIPCQLLGRFALDKSVQGKAGVAEFLMSHAIEQYRQVSRLTGTRFLLVEVKNKSLLGYYQRYGFKVIAEPSQDQLGKLVLLT